MIKIDMTSPDTDRQVLLLQEYPQIARKHFLPAVKRATQILAALIRPTIPSPSRYGTGRARSDFTYRTTGTTVENIQGRVGFDDAWHMNIVEYGARRHLIKPGVSRRGSKLNQRVWDPENVASRLSKSGGRLFKYPVNIKGVGWRMMDIHPGFGGKFFLKAGYEKGRPMVENELAIANERVAKDLTV